MIDPDTINSASAAFIAGLVTSVHCVGMCGPMACAFAPGIKDKTEVVKVTTIYHLSRILAYTAIGALAGAISSLGKMPMAYFNTSPARFLPWALVVFFLAMVFRLDRYLPKPKSVTKWAFRISQRVSKWPKSATGMTLGLVTPFLPCGPLYAVFFVALLTGSPLKGAEFLLGFGFGTLPLLWITHTQYLHWREKFSPVWIDRAQRGMALVAALIIVWRLTRIMGMADPNALPPCCH